MATMVTSTRPPVTKKGAGSGPGLPGPNGNGSRRKGGFPDPDSRANRYRIGMWVGLASVAMMFTSLSSAYFVRYASANDWVPLAIPRVMFASTVLILISSVTLELARRKLKRSVQPVYTRYLLFTVLLGLAFLASQLISWRQLAGQGIYLSSNPHSSFFYLLTGAHAVHLLGGLLALTFLWLRSQRKVTEAALVAKRQATTDAVTIYWHFMDGLWIYLFLLLFLWR
ncbi:MAG TPA: cytochrome c oxidase subunit 3 [Pyrinomonadaceae bacterium]|nr:cytochrome c oxidase subunit 3 [Pyrinomonadaceae bacterium]